MKLYVLHNIQKVFDKYFIYLYMFDTEDSENAMSRLWPIYWETYTVQTVVAYFHHFKVICTIKT